MLQKGKWYTVKMQMQVIDPNIETEVALVHKADGSLVMVYKTDGKVTASIALSDPEEGVVP